MGAGVGITSHHASQDKGLGLQRTTTARRCTDLKVADSISAASSGDGKIDLENAGGCPEDRGELARDGHEQVHMGNVSSSVFRVLRTHRIPFARYTSRVMENLL